MAKAIKTPIVTAQMLIRRPVAKVFQAFVDPAITTRFWFSKSSGTLAPGKRIRWEWEMYGAFSDVDVRKIEPNALILIEWGSPERTTTVEFAFERHGDDQTMVVIKN